MEPSANVIESGRRLGKLPPKFDERTFKLARYIEKRRIPRVPRKLNRSRRLLKTFGHDLGMMRNDEYGNCTCVGKAHMHQGFSVFGEIIPPFVPSDDEILAAYDRINGGRDEGAAMLDALNDWRNVGMAGNKILAYATVDPLNHDQVRTAAYLFGGLYAGAMLPVSAKHQKVWDVGSGGAADAPGSWGGHAFNVVDYDEKTITIVTWGELQKLTWAWWDRYVDEVYAVVEEDWAGPDRRSPQGFSLKKLLRDIAAL